VPLEGLKGTRLEQIWMSSGERRPAFRIYIWNPRQTTVQDIVLRRWEGMRYDITDWVIGASVEQNQVFENNNDPVSSRCSLTIKRDTKGIQVGAGLTIPVTERLFSNGMPIQITMGDRRIFAQDWPPIFTGVVRGHAGGHTANRGEANIQVQCFGRAQAFQKQIIVGINFDFGTDLGDMAVDTAMIELGLEREEIRFGLFGAITKQKANALAQIEKMQGLFQIMHHVGRKPYFNSRGQLVAHDTSFSKPPVYTFDRSPLIRSITRSQHLGNIINSVNVFGLSHKLSRVNMTSRALQEINVTVGYFDSHYKEVIFFSADKTLRASNTSIQIVHSSSFGSGATWTPIDEFSGKLDIDTGYAPELIGLVITAWVLVALAEYLFLGSGQTTIAATLGAAKASLTVGILLLMQEIGRWRIFVLGEPFEFVHEELSAIAVLKGIITADVNEGPPVSLHWLHNLVDVASRAKDLLTRELVKGQQYVIEMAQSAVLETDDVISIRDPDHLPNDDFWDFYIKTIRHRVRRGDGLMSLTAWHIGGNDDC